MVRVEQLERLVGDSGGEVSEVRSQLVQATLEAEEAKERAKVSEEEKEEVK